MKNTAIIMMILTVAWSAQATILNWNTTTGDYGTAGSWNPVQAPTSADDVRVNNGGTATISSGAHDAATFYTGQANDSSGNLSMSGGSLTVVGNFYSANGKNTDDAVSLGGSSVINAANMTLGSRGTSVTEIGSSAAVDLSGTLRVGLYGPDVNSTLHGNSTFNLSGTATVGKVILSSNGGIGAFNLNGGTLACSGDFDMDDNAALANRSAALTVNGSAGSFSANNLYGVDEDATLNFVADSGGFTKLDIANAINIDGATLNINADAYAGAEPSLVLMDGSSLEGSFINVNFTGSHAGWTTYDRNNGDLLLTVHRYVEQIDVPQIEQMPNLPQPYQMRDWKQVALDFDELVFNLQATGDYLPTIWLDTSDKNYAFDGFGLDSYVGKYSSGSGNAREATCCIPAVVGASLVGVDKRSQQGHDFVKMCQKFYNTDNGQGVILNSSSSLSANNFNYTVQPCIYFFQLAHLYPNGGEPEGELQDIVKSVADRWYAAEQAMGGLSVSSPDFNHSAFDFITMTPVDNGVFVKPDSAGGIAWMQLMAWAKFGDTKYLQGADWGLQFLEECEQNPLTHAVLAYGSLAAARINAEENRNYNVEKLLNWTFGPSDGVARPGWGVMAGAPWNGYDASGLVGAAANQYAFAYESFQLANALAPLPRYDQRFARAIGKYLLNLANSAWLFYGNALDEDHQSSEAWVEQYDPNYAMAYEAVRAEWEGISPYIMGDASRNNWDRAPTDLAPYGGASVGILGALVETTDVEAILKVDLLATDYFHKSAHPTFLYYNPYETVQQVGLDIGTSPQNLYDSVTGRFIQTNATGTVSVMLEPDSAIILVQFNADEPLGRAGEKLLAGGAVIDYWNGNLDSDADGLPDWWESRYFGNVTNTAPETLSANGRSHLENYQIGFDPTDPNAVFEMEFNLPLGGYPEIQWPSVGGKTYAVEVASQLDAAEGFIEAAVITETNALAGEPATGRFSDESPNPSNRFYRVNLIVQ